MTITNATVHHNGTGYQAQVTLYLSTGTLLNNSPFTDISASIFSNSADPTKLAAVFTLYKSNLHIRDCSFMRNNISAIKAFASNVSVSSNLTISSNRAFDGTGFILVENSIVSLEEGSHIQFSDNHATNTGGVFYTSNNVYLDPYSVVRSVCFINTHDSTSGDMLTFMNNSASNGGDILYGGHVALSVNGYVNCLDLYI